MYSLFLRILTILFINYSLVKLFLLLSCFYLHFLLFLSGQVLKHVNLGNYLASKVCSLRELQSGSKNGESKLSSLVSLANAMRVLYT